MDNETEVPLLLILIRRKRIKDKYKKRFWIHPLNLQRTSIGEHIKVEQMYNLYPEKFFEYTRLTCKQFDKLVNLVSEEITKRDTNFRSAISPRIRLFVTLRFLASGDSFVSLSTSYSLGTTTVWRIIKETTIVIWEKLAPLYVKPPDKEKWKTIMEDFNDIWNFPNCLGAIDGKHVQIQAPSSSGSSFYNYKGYFSIVLLATCDAHYKFTTLDIGAYGRQSDGGIFLRSALGQSLNNGTFPFPPASDIKDSPFHHPCVFVGDEAFSLSSLMMRPYPGKFLPVSQRIFNYRLSRARRVIENSFGIMCSRFRVFRRSLISEPMQAINIVKATVALHNFILSEESLIGHQERLYCPVGFADQNDQPNGEWRNISSDRDALQRITRTGSNSHSKVSKQMRENLKNYFMNDGQVSWQYERAGIFID